MYNVSQDELVQLSRIYNTLLTIETRGENTIVMGDCLRALQQSLQSIQQNPVQEAAPELTTED